MPGCPHPERQQLQVRLPWTDHLQHVLCWLPRGRQGLLPGTSNGHRHCLLKWTQKHFRSPLLTCCPFRLRPVREIPVAPWCAMVSCRAWCPGVMAVPRGTSLESTPRSATTTPGFAAPCPPTKVTLLSFVVGQTVVYPFNK